MDTKIKAAGDRHPQAAQTLNLPSYFIAEAMQGKASGARLIRELQDLICDADRLFHKLHALVNSLVASRSFCRDLQNHITKRGLR